MNIRYFKTNLSNISNENILKFLADVILSNINSVSDYNINNVYNIGDRVYFKENGTHHIYECIKSPATGVFDPDKWRHVVEVYKGPLPTVYALTVKEEVRVIEESETKELQLNLEFDTLKSTVAVYNRKERLVIGYDFDITADRKIVFKKDIAVGTRLIFEVREKVTKDIFVGIVLYDLNGNPYVVAIDNNGVVKIDKTTEHKPDDIKYATLATGDKVYTLLVDGNGPKPELALFERVETTISDVDGYVYKVEITDGGVKLVDPGYDGFSDTDVILGTDGKFYRVRKNENNDLIPVLADNQEKFEKSSYTLGYKTINTKFKKTMVDIIDGQVVTRPYILNGGYNNIVLKSTNGEIHRLTISDSLDLELHDTRYGEGTHTDVLDAFYFFDENWDYFKLYIEDHDIVFENVEITNSSLIPDSDGINIVSPSGEICKISLGADGVMSICKVVDLDNGTFASPLRGFVVMDNGVKKLLTLDIQSSKFVVTEAPSNMKFRTNHHYIMSSTGELYKLHYNGDMVELKECDINDYTIRNKQHGSFIEANEVISMIDIKDGKPVIKPISTFTHTIKSDDGSMYLLNVVGDNYREKIELDEIDPVVAEKRKLGVGELYIKDSNGDCYVGSVRNGRLDFVRTDENRLIDYDLTSLIYSAKGWYKFMMTDGNLSFTKYFDNIYTPDMCAANIVYKDFVLTSENNTTYSLYADGNSELQIRNTRDIPTNGTLLRSSNGSVYALGTIDDTLITQRSYIAYPSRIPTEYLIKDSVTGNKYAIKMYGSRLGYEPYDGNDKNIHTELEVYDVYGDKSILVMMDERLTVMTEVIKFIVNSTGDKHYKLMIGNNPNSIDFVQFMEVVDDTELESGKSGVIKIRDQFTDKSYYGVIDSDVGELIFNETDEIHRQSTQYIETNKGNYVLGIFNGDIELDSTSVPKNIADALLSPDGDVYRLTEEGDENDFGIGLEKVINADGINVGEVIVSDNSGRTYAAKVNNNGTMEFEPTDSNIEKPIIKTNRNNLYKFVIVDEKTYLRRI